MQYPMIAEASPVAQLVKNPPAMRETWVRSLGWEYPLEKGKATLQSSGLENSMDRGAWWAIVHRATNSWTRLKQLSTHTAPHEGHK